MLFRIGQFKSIYTRMFLVICIAAIPTFLGLCLYVYQQRNYLLEFSQENALRFAKLAAHEENGRFASTRETLKAIGAAPLVKAQDWALCRRYMADLLKSQTLYVNLAIFSVKGDSLCSGLPDSGDPAERHFADRPYFQRALSSQGMVISEFHIGRISHLPTLVVALALRDEANQPTAVMVASVNISAMAEVRNTQMMRAGGGIVILDRDGVVLDSSSGVYPVGQTLSEPALISTLASGHEGAKVIKDADGSNLLVSYARIGLEEDPNALTLLFQYPAKELLAEINRTFWLSILATLVLMLLALTLGWFGLQAFVGRNITYLTKAATQLRKRKFNTRIAPLTTGAEFQDIARQFDEMAKELGEQEQHWEDTMRRQRSQNQILRLIARDRPIEETLVTLARFMQEQHIGTLASIILLTPDGQRVENCIAPDVPEALVKSLIGVEVRPRMGTCATAILNKRIAITEDIRTDPDWEVFGSAAVENGLLACWSHPIFSADNRVLGTFAAYLPEPGGPDLHDLQLAKTAAELAAIAIEHRRQSDTLRYQSDHDVLTGLYNRQALITYASRILAQPGSAEQEYYVLILNLDGFNEINATLGYTIGDELLRQVSSRLSACVTSDSLVARSGSNEFSLVIAQSDLSEAITSVVRRLLNEIKQPFLLDNVRVQISASMGIAIYPRHGEFINTLMRHANAAMYQARSQGTSYSVHDPQLDQRAGNRLLLLSELRQALQENEFVLHYQPKICLRTGRTVGLEALIRWQHPREGLLAPDKFIHAVELSDLIHPLTLWVVEMALKQCRAWRDQGHDITIAVNVSARNLTDTALAKRIHEALRRHDMPTCALEVELTESSIMADPSRSARVLRRLRDIGVRVAIDDFGTGHSSLAYLQRLPVDNLKLDKSFVMDMKGANTHAIIGTVIQLAHDLSINVTAEGIEDNATLQKLYDMGCDFGQGYYVARPMSAEQASLWLKANSKGPAR